MAAYDPLVRAVQYRDGLEHSAYTRPGMLHGGAQEPMSQYPLSQRPSFNQNVEAPPPIPSASQQDNGEHSHWQAQPEIGHSTALPYSTVDDDSSSSMDEPDTGDGLEATSVSSDQPPPGVAAIGGQYQDMEEHLIPNGVNWFMSVFA